MRLVFFAAAIAVLGHATTPYQQLVERLRTARAIECRARTASGESVRILAARGGKLRLESPQRTIVSNGSVVWNYVPAQKTVTISSYAPGSGATFDRIAFELLDQYQPVQESISHVTVRPRSEPLYGVRSITLEFHRSSLRALTVDHISGTERWQIQSLRFDPQLSQASFEFTVPPNVEVMDIR
ncbi:MAG: hypothetical protein RML15_07360 [Bacteroidota bacterium]|nr:hypothetical protein [Candidatus Kapabacteria bacterium]MCX7936697.1 hypothetical protein [Chlorobiota bacterium]MDW8272210.1 hypothetical protein [Bacteroidota bacterium]